MSIEDVFLAIENYSETIKGMAIDEYDEKAVISMINLGCEVNERGNADEKNMAIAYLYDTLKTDAGIIFTTTHKSFAQMAVTQAQRFLSQIGSSTYEGFLEVKNSIMRWFKRSEDMLRSHGINYSLPIFLSDGTDNVDHLTSELDDFIRYERNMEDEYNEDDYEDDDDEEYNENHDLEDDGEEDEEYQEYVQHINNINNYETKIVAGQIAEKKKFENDPFYQAALSLLKEKSKHLEESKEETEKIQIDALRNIVRREIELSSDIESNSFFRCEYRVAEHLTGEPVTEYITKKIGASISIKFSDGNDDVSVYVFDGTRIHEIDFNINMREMIEKLKKEIRKDNLQALYDLGYCRDIAVMISEYVC
jgi:hypothetical protein